MQHHRSFSVKMFRCRYPVLVGLLVWLTWFHQTRQRLLPFVVVIGDSSSLASVSNSSALHSVPPPTTTTTSATTSALLTYKNDTLVTYKNETIVPKVLPQKDKHMDTLQQQTSTVTNHKLTRTPTNNATHDYFDCQRPHSTCRDFFPIEFFDRVSGPGYAYRSQAHQTRYDSPQRRMHVNYLRFRQNNRNNTTSDTAAAAAPWYAPSDFTYVHVRKAGGITLKYFGWQLETQQPYKMEDGFTKDVAARWQQQGPQPFLQHLQDMVDTTRLFTFVRNPVSRFVSAMGHYVAVRSTEGLSCSDNIRTAPPLDAMRCVLDALLNTSMFVDEHFVPASHELYQITSLSNRSNTSVAVWSLSQLGAFVNDWLPLRQNLQMNHHAKNGIKARFANSYSALVSNASMLRDVCRVYAVDVHMIRSLQVLSVPECDPYVPVWRESRRL